MMHGSNYETLDWELEAQRVAAAFEVAEPCHFTHLRGITSYVATERETDLNKSLLLKNGLYVDISYDRESKVFVVSEINENGYVKHSCLIVVGWGGPNRTVRYGKRSAQPDYILHTLAKALLFLDLLTPEVETQIGISITAHERIEWTLEHEARNGL